MKADEGIVTGSLNLEETILCTPAALDGQLYIRSDKHLWKITSPLVL
ncbi:MAG: hypothetical protein LR011_10975 [Verrucomicrobia bacterium]|nr:hypothetical protein [Verrucomicrobiota bacterium]